MADLPGSTFVLMAFLAVCSSGPSLCADDLVTFAFVNILMPRFLEGYLVTTAEVDILERLGKAYATVIPLGMRLDHRLFGGLCMFSSGDFFSLPPIDRLCTVKEQPHIGEDPRRRSLMMERNSTVESQLRLWRTSRRGMQLEGFSSGLNCHE